MESCWLTCLISGLVLTLRSSFCWSWTCTRTSRWPGARPTTLSTRGWTGARRTLKPSPTISRGYKVSEVALKGCSKMLSIGSWPQKINLGRPRSLTKWAPSWIGVFVIARTTFSMFLLIFSLLWIEVVVIVRSWLNRLESGWSEGHLDRKWPRNKPRQPHFENCTLNFRICGFKWRILGWGWI